MIEALWDFFGLYKAGSDYLPGFWLTMLLLYLNAGLYLADLYHLVKRKSKAETVSLMAIPGIFAILLVSVASFFTHVPNLLRETSRAKCLKSAYNDNVAGNEPCAASCCVSLSGSMGNRVLASAEARAWQLQTLGAVQYSGLYCMDYTGVWYRLSPDFRGKYPA